MQTHAHALAHEHTHTHTHTHTHSLTHTHMRTHTRPQLLHASLVSAWQNEQLRLVQLAHKQQYTHKTRCLQQQNQHALEQHARALQQPHAIWLAMETSWVNQRLQLLCVLLEEEDKVCWLGKGGAASVYCLWCAS